MAHSKKYNAYVRSPEWAQKRLEAIARAGGRCENCGSVFRLEVHHRNYLRLGREKSADLAVLCAVCHRKQHRRK